MSITNGYAIPLPYPRCLLCPRSLLQHHPRRLDYTTSKSNTRHGVYTAQALRGLQTPQAATQDHRLHRPSVPQHFKSFHLLHKTHSIHRLSRQIPKCLPIFVPSYIYTAAWSDRQRKYRHPRPASSLRSRHCGRRGRGYKFAIQPGDQRR